MKLYILTSTEHANFYSDDKNLSEVLDGKGLEWELVIWDKDFIPDNATVLIRTIWDYTEKEEQFRSLLDDFTKRNIKILNPVETILWNMDKSYLNELGESGVSVVPTYISKNFTEGAISESGIDYPLVVKPLVGASGRDTFLLESANYQEDISNLNNQKVMIQPFMQDILKEGEISFIYFGNEFSHAVIKSATENEFRIQEEYGGSVKEYLPTQSELDDVQKILSGVKYEWCYARVDVVRDSGKFYLMELELIEPELFFRFSKGGELKLIEAIAD